VKWAEVDIETGELPDLAVGGFDYAADPFGRNRLCLFDAGHRNRSSAGGPSLVHEVGGLVVVDHSAAAPYRLTDIDEIDADAVAVNAMAWVARRSGAGSFRDPR